MKSAARIVHGDSAAAAIGLRPGMTLADARARVPELEAVAHDASADALLLARLAHLTAAFSPSVAMAPPDGIDLDITGCAHLFGGEAGLAARLRASLTRAGVSRAHVAIAPTPDMARALARFGRTIEIIADDDRAVRQLPVAALECAPEDATALRRAGLRTIADVADRPSILFTARFTAAFTTKLARVLGEEDRRISAERPLPAYVWDHRCPEPLASTEAINEAMRSLAERARHDMEQAGEGGRAFETAFFRTDGLVRRIRVETSEPARDPALILRLYAERLDAIADPLDPGFGFDLIRFHVLHAEPFLGGEASFEAQDNSRRELNALIDRLAARFGSEHVTRLEPIDTHLPEHVQLTVLASDPPRGIGGAAARRQATLRGKIWTAPEPGRAPVRPLSLFAPPHLIDVETTASDSGPVRFHWRRVVHDILVAEGPERIAGPWWDESSGHGARDYYRVETSEGRRFWLFRAAPDSGPASSRLSWFLHGVFA